MRGEVTRILVSDPIRVRGRRREVSRVVDLEVLRREHVGIAGNRSRRGGCGAGGNGCIRARESKQS